MRSDLQIRTKQKEDWVDSSIPMWSVNENARDKIQEFKSKEGWIPMILNPTLTWLKRSSATQICILIYLAAAAFVGGVGAELGKRLIELICSLSG